MDYHGDLYLYVCLGSNKNLLLLLLFTRCAENAARFGIRYRNQFLFPSLVSDPGRQCSIGKLNHSSSGAIFIQDKMLQHQMRIPVIKYVIKSLPIFG